jgi:hypothetical protein
MPPKFGKPPAPRRRNVESYEHTMGHEVHEARERMGIPTPVSITPPHPARMAKFGKPPMPRGKRVRGY